MNDNERQTLRDVAQQAIDRAPGDIRAQTRMCRSAVMMDSRLLLELLGFTVEHVEARLLVYLRGIHAAAPVTPPAESKHQQSMSERRAKKAAQAERAIARDIALSGSKTPHEFQRNVSTAAKAIKHAVRETRAYITSFSSLGKEIDFSALDRGKLFEGVRQGSTVARLCDALLKGRGPQAWAEGKTVGELYSPEEFAAIRDEVFADAITPERYGMPEIAS